LVPPQAPKSESALYEIDRPKRLQSGHPFILAFFALRPSPQNGQRCNHTWYPTNHQLPTRTPSLTHCPLSHIPPAYSHTHPHTHAKIIRDIPHSPPGTTTFFPPCADHAQTNLRTTLQIACRK
jgi:hypothetical protein